MSKLHSKEISFNRLIQTVKSVDKLSKDNGNLFERKKLWDTINKEISDILQESFYRQKMRNSIDNHKKTELEEDISVFEELLCEVDNESEKKEILKDIDEAREKLFQLDNLSDKFSIKDTEKRIFDVISYKTQKEGELKNFIVPTLKRSDIWEIAGLSNAQKKTDFKLKNGVKLGDILKICDIDEGDLSFEGYRWIIVCRHIAKKMSSDAIFREFMRDSKITTYSQIHDPSHNTWLYGDLLAG